MSGATAGQREQRIVTIRPLTPADRAEILRINAASGPGVVAIDGAEFERLCSLGGTHLVAEAGAGALAGYALAFAHGCPYDGEEFNYFRAHLRRPFLYVDQLAVDPARKRSGVGAALYAALIDRAGAERLEVLCCEVNTTPPNPVSLQFHLRLGFIVAGNGDTLDGRRVAFLTRSV